MDYRRNLKASDSRIFTTRSTSPTEITVTQASDSRQLRDVFPPPPKRRSPRSNVAPFLRQRGGWLLAAVLAATMLLWNWKLFLATSFGMGVTVGAYSLSLSPWTIRWIDLRRWLSDTHRPVTFAVVSGGLATFCTYMATSIWASAENRWMASGLILQGFATLGILLLLVWQTLDRLLGREAVNLDAALKQLTENDTLKQVVALRQIQRWTMSGSVDDVERQTISDCCRVLLSRELETVVRDAALDTLKVAQAQTASLPPGTQAPIHWRPSVRKVATHKRKVWL